MYFSDGYEVVKKATIVFKSSILRRHGCMLLTEGNLETFQVMPDTRERPFHASVLKSVCVCFDRWWWGISLIRDYMKHKNARHDVLSTSINFGKSTCSW